MADVFVSYSRSDSELVNRLVERLRERGKDVWVDVEGIRDAEVFPAALRRAVEGSDGFVFVISPDSVASPFCEQEVDHAVELNKRIVPLAFRSVPDEQVPEGIRVRNWIPVGDGDFDAGVERLVQALDTDLEWDRAHTHWLLKAIEWDESGRDRSFLLRGSELAAAEGWLASSADKDPGPTALQQEYVYASRGASTRRQRTLAGASLLVAAVSVALLVFALISRHDAVNERTTAESRALAGRAATSSPSIRSCRSCSRSRRSAPRPRRTRCSRSAARSTRHRCGWRFPRRVSSNAPTTSSGRASSTRAATGSWRRSATGTCSS